MSNQKYLLNTENQFEDKVVIVTGSAQGMGKAVAKKFGAYGAKIVINDIREDNLKLTENEFVKSGFNTFALGKVVVICSYLISELSMFFINAFLCSDVLFNFL